ncbi:MAG: hypothetical protein LBL73_02160 [Synergistaceae bacterium]|jgi:hypothetical protein|nr:hypothetical protein [Synergistaceae bacterium]
MLARRSFTLVELAVTCSVVAILCGCINLAASPVIAVFLDESRERAVEREVRETASWIKSYLHRARALRRDMRIYVPAVPATPVIYFEGKNDVTERYALYGESIGFRASSAYFAYNHLHQTMTPAFQLRILKVTDSGYEMTDWVVKVSGRGHVTPEKQPVKGL